MKVNVELFLSPLSSLPQTRGKKANCPRICSWTRPHFAGGIPIIYPDHCSSKWLADPLVKQKTIAVL